MLMYYALLMRAICFWTELTSICHLDKLWGTKEYNAWSAGRLLDCVSSSVSPHPFNPTQLKAYFPDPITKYSHLEERVITTSFSDDPAHHAGYTFRRPHAPLWW